MEHGLLTLPEHLSSPPVFRLMGKFLRPLVVLLYFFVWPLSVLFRYTDTDYPFGIFKFFLYKTKTAG